MYDARSELHEFVGADRFEAMSKACAFFGVEEADLEVGAPAPGEVMGLGTRFVVVAGLKDRQRPARSGGGREREERPERAERGERRGREFDRGRGRRGGEEGGRREQRPEREAREEAPVAMLPAATAPSVGTALTPLSRIGEFVQGLVERIDAGPFEISESSEGDVIAVQLRGPAATRLGEGDARAADAIQLLANQASMRDGDDAKRVVVEAEGDGQGREDHLTRLAERAAKRALETGRAVAIDAMSPRDRRVIHVALRDAEDIATMSIGSGRYRQVVVVPAGAPEYEEARRQAQASGRRED
jgi:spoIIIJ-associated protein